MARHRLRTLAIVITVVAVAVAAALALSTGPRHGPRLEGMRAAAGAAHAARSARLAPHDLRIVRGGHTLLLTFYRNRVPVSAARTAVILIHGTARDANAYYGYGLDSPSFDPSTTLLVCPLFLETQDLQDHPDIGPSYLYWPTSNEDLPRDRMVFLTNHNSYLPSLDSWSLGRPSATAPYGRPFAVSSYACIDNLVEWILAHYPRVGSIRIAGHSAGGVFVTRYALGERVTAAFPAVRFRFAPMNATTYCYLSAKRDPRLTGTFTMPRHAPRCYDWYRYSIDGKLSGCSYLGSAGAAAIRTDYRGRTVMVCVGSADTKPTGDDSASALLQGAHRYERGVIFARYVVDRYGGFAPSHTLRVVPNVGHDAHAMLRDAVISSYLFGP